MKHNYRVLGFSLALLLGVFVLLSLQGCKIFGTASGRDPSQPEFNGYYEIASPTEGARLNLDSSYTVLWSQPSNVSEGSVILSLYQGKKCIVPQLALIKNQGNYYWSLPSSIVLSDYKFGSGIGYRIKISSQEDTSRWDFSPTFKIFSKYNGTVSLTSPTATTNAVLDSNFTIQWKVGGEVGNAIGIQMLKDTVADSLKYTANPAIGSYSIPRLYSSFGSGKDFHIRIYSLSDPTIASLSPAFRISSNYYGTLNFVSPGLGDTLLAGLDAFITWIATGNPGTTLSLVLYRDSIPIERVSIVNPANPNYSWRMPEGLISGSHYRIRISSENDPSIKSYSDYFTINGSEPDAYENDDSLFFAKTITTDGKIQAHTLPHLDADYLRLNTVQGRRYLIALRSTSTALLSVLLKDSLGVNQGDSRIGSNLQWVMTASYTGFYHLLVNSVVGGAAYTIGVSDYDTNTTTFNLKIGSPESQSTWDVGKTFVISWTPDSLFYGPTVNLSLFNDTAMVQTITTNSKNTGSYAWTLPGTLITSDKYRIRISSSTNAQVFSYSSVFTISGLNPDVYEPDNAKITAKYLFPDSASQNHSLTSQDSDWLRFDAKIGNKYLITFASSLSLTTYLLDSNGLQLNKQLGSNYSLALSPSYTGAYYLRVESTASYGNYTVSLIAYDSTQSGYPVKFTSPDSNSVWAAGSPYSLIWVPDQSLFGTYVSLDLYLDTTLVRQISSSTSNTTGGYSWTFPTGLVTSNKYRIRITNYSNPQIYGSSASFTISGVSVDSYEPDNIISNAKNINGNGLLQEHNLTLSDTDWVGLDARMGYKYLIGIASTTTLSTYLFDSAGNQLKVQSGTKYALALAPTYTGRYYVRMLSPGVTGNYSISVTASDSIQPEFPVKFTSPDTSSTWIAGTTYSIQWLPDLNLFGSYVVLNLYKDTTFVRQITASVVNGVSGYNWSIPSGLATSNKYRIRIKSYNTPEVYGSSPYFTINGQADDNFEPDNAVSLAKTITTDGILQNHNFVLNDTDCIRFDAKTGKFYQITVKGSVSVLAYMLDSTGVQLSYQTGTSYTLTLKPSYSGSYYLRMQYGGTSGTYSVAVTAFDSTQLGYPTQFIAPDSSISWIAGSSHYITWIPDQTLYSAYVRLELFLDTTFIAQIASAVNNSTSGNYWSLPIGLATSNKYRIRMRNYYYPEIFGTGAYFAISGKTPDLFEPNNALATAKTITTDGIAQAHSLTLNDTDWIRLEAKPGKRYLASVASTFTTSSYLLDSNGRYLSSNSGYNYSLSFSPGYTGSYYIRMQASGYYGDYSVAINTFDSTQVGFPIQFSKPDSVNVWSSGSTYLIDWTADQALYGTSVSLSLYLDTVFVTQIASGITNGFTGVSWNIPSGLMSSSKYRIRVQNYYDPTIFGMSPVFSISGMLSDGFEPDDGQVLAKPISTDGVLQKHNLTFQDSDWVSFDAILNQTYIISQNAGKTQYLYILDSSGGLLNSQSGTNMSFVFVPPSTGKYFIRLQSYSTVTGDYSISVQNYPTSPSTLPTKFIAPDSSATWATGGYYFATWIPDTLLFGKYVSLDLYRDSLLMQSLTGYASNNGSYSVLVPFGLGSGNNYRIRMKNYQNTDLSGYSEKFSISGIASDVFEPNDSSSTAGVVIPNAGKQILSLSLKDEDWFRFSGKANLVYVFRAISESSLFTSMRLFSGLGVNVIKSSSKTNDTLNTISWTCPMDGIYSLLVDANTILGTNSGIYSLEIRELDATGYKFVLTNPLDKASLKFNQNVTVTWTDPSSVLGTVDLFLYNSLGVVNTITSSLNNVGSYLWSVPSSLPTRTDYYIKVISRNNSTINGISGSFSIVP